MQRERRRRRPALAVRGGPPGPARLHVAPRARVAVGGLEPRRSRHWAPAAPPRSFCARQPPARGRTARSSACNRRYATAGSRWPVWWSLAPRSVAQSLSGCLPLTSETDAGERESYAAEGGRLTIAGLREDSVAQSLADPEPPAPPCEGAAALQRALARPQRALKSDAIEQRMGNDEGGDMGCLAARRVGTLGLGGGGGRAGQSRSWTRRFAAAAWPRWRLGELRHAAGRRWHGESQVKTAAGGRSRRRGQTRRCMD